MQDAVIRKMNELNELHNPDVPLDVQKFWNTIMAHSDISNELGEQGNSGEFHDHGEEMRLIKELEEVLEKLIDLFTSNTGYKPVYVNLKGQQFQGIWKFTKI